jgi:hypothetical protein
MSERKWRLCKCGHKFKNAKWKKCYQYSMNIDSWACCPACDLPIGIKGNCEVLK